MTRDLERIFGRGSVLDSPAARLAYSYDATGMHCEPDCVAFASGAAEVGRLLRLANEQGFPVVPRGAGTGYTGGSVPVEGGVVLVTERMRRIVEIDEENLTVTAEAGVVTGDLHKAVERVGLFYPPDPASMDVCTIGGNVAECAGGPRAFKYGVTRNYVLQLEAVLPTGELFLAGARTVKSVAGYDLARLLTGSEGTLAVITKATLRLIPKPATVETLLCAFADPVAAGRAVAAVVKERIVPCTLELVDGECIRCVGGPARFGLPEGARALLLVEVDGEPQAVAAAAAAVREVCLRCGALEAKTAGSPEAAEELWQARRSISPALMQLAPTKINEDIVVPRSAVPEMLARLAQVSRDRRVLIATFGHVGDGNLHVNIMCDERDLDELARATAAVEDVFAATLALGGSVSGEHGIGVTKAPFLPREIGEAGIATMLAVKRALDPNGVLNPGKIFVRARPRGGAADDSHSR